jgi:hypothetical protein
MKHKDLYNYIREEIINELTTVTKTTTSDEIQDIAKAEKTNPNTVKKAIDTAKSTGKDVNIAEVDLEEMANIASVLKIQDPTKLALAKEIYSSGRYADVLSAIETAGEEGTTQKQLGQILQINDTVLNPIINNLRAAGILSPKREKIVKPEKPTKDFEPDQPEIDEPDTTKADDFYKVDKDFDSSEEEPTAIIDKYAEELGKLNNRLSQLVAKKNDILKKYKDGDINLDQYKIEIGTIPSQIKKIQDKITDYSKID